MGTHTLLALLMETSHDVGSSLFCRLTQGKLENGKTERRKGRGSLGHLAEGRLPGMPVTRAQISIGLTFRL